MITPGTHLYQTGGFFYLRDKAGLSKMLTGQSNPDLFFDSSAHYKMTMQLMYSENEDSQLTRIALDEEKKKERFSTIHMHEPWSFTTKDSKYKIPMEDHTGIIYGYKAAMPKESDLLPAHPDQTTMMSGIPPHLVQGRGREDLFRHGTDIGFAEFEFPLAGMTYAKIFSSSITNFRANFKVQKLKAPEEIMLEMIQTETTHFMAFIRTALDEGFIAPVEDAPVKLIRNALTAQFG